MIKKMVRMPIIMTSLLNILPFVVYSIFKYSIVPSYSILKYYALCWLAIIISVVFFITMVVFLFIRMIRRRNKENLRNWVISIIISLISFIIFIGILFIPDKTFESEFSKNMIYYDNAVSIVRQTNINSTEALKMNSSSEEYYLIKLPIRYRYLSKGGYVLYKEIDGVVNIFFIRGTDILYERLYGYIYKSSSKEYQVGDGKGIFWGEPIPSKENWFIRRP